MEKINIVFECLQGKNKKYFVKIQNIVSKIDMEIHENVASTLRRKEYKPFLQSFNKNIEASYLFYEVLFPVQFWEDVKANIKKMFGYEPELINEDLLIEHKVDETSFEEFLNNLKLPEKYDIKSDKYKYQRECAYLGLRNKIGRIEIGTSGGKTFITYLYCRYALKYLATDNDKILIIVPSKMLAKQLADDFNEYQQLETDKIVVQSIFTGAKKVANAKIVCGTYHSISEFDKEYFDEYRFILCDELHRAKAYSIKKEIYDKVTNADFFFGMTGTFPEYKTLDYLHIVSMFGGLLYEKNVRSLIDDGISVPTDINIIKIQYDKDKDFCKDLLAADIVGTEKYFAEKSFFQRHEGRNKIICKLIGHFKDNALILVDTIDYCGLLKEVLTEQFGDTKKIEIINGSVKNRDEIVDNMKRTEHDFILIGTYGTMSTGVSIPNIGQIYFVDGGKSAIRIRQSVGRGIRLSPGKSKCLVFDFYDDMQKSSFKNHAKERMRIYDDQKLPYKIKQVTI